MSIQPDLVLAACPACGNSLVKLDHVRQCVDRLRAERHGFQIMARMMLLGHDPGFYLSALDEGKYERAGGDVECAACRIPYKEHPELPRLPTFHMLCSGDVVKT